MNIDKQVAYWLDGAKEDWEVSGKLLEMGNIRHGLFFAHLTIEKTLKALYTKRLGQVPPKLHNLAKLAKMAGISIEEALLETLLVVNTFNIEGRYPEGDSSTLPSKQEASKIRKETEELYQWLTTRL